MPPVRSRIGESPAQPVLEGRVDGHRLTFRTTILLNGKEQSISWEGVEKDDRLSLVRTFGSSGRSFGRSGPSSGGD